MKQKCITQWRYSVNYTRKHCYEISSYLNVTRKTINRKALVKLRISNHKLMIETGRYNQTPHNKLFSLFDGAKIGASATLMEAAGRGRGGEKGNACLQTP